MHVVDFFAHCFLTVVSADVTDIFHHALLNTSMSMSMNSHCFKCNVHAKTVLNTSMSIAESLLTVQCTCKDANQQHEHEHIIAYSAVQVQCYTVLTFTCVACILSELPRCIGHLVTCTL